MRVLDMFEREGPFRVTKIIIVERRTWRSLWLKPTREVWAGEGYKWIRVSDGQYGSFELSNTLTRIWETQNLRDLLEPLKDLVEEQKPLKNFRGNYRQNASRTS